MESPEHEKRHVTDYLRGQLDDETVEHAEKFMSEWVGGTRHDVWDVQTDGGRWWVVTNPTNFYPHDHFKSMDTVLSFHLGLMARVFSRRGAPGPEERPPFLSRAWRQWEQAAEAAGEGEETEEFQAVGMRCREALISFVHDSADDAFVPEGETTPKLSDVVHWTELIANALAPSKSGAALRAYLKAIAKQTWDYVAWLTHAKNAGRLHADIAVEGTAQVISAYGLSLLDRDKGAAERCPSCGSLRVGDESWLDSESGEWVSRDLCEACGWSTPEDRQKLEPLPPRPPAPPPEGECVTGESAGITTRITPDEIRRRNRN